MLQRDFITALYRLRTFHLEIADVLYQELERLILRNQSSLGNCIEIPDFNNSLIETYSLFH
jgi:hypothetical protein